MSNWTAALKEVGLTAWPRLRDVNLIGHAVDNPVLALELVRRGITKWSQLTRQGRLMDKPTLERTIGVPLTYDGYHNIRKAACIPNTLAVNEHTNTVISIEKAMTAMHRTLITDEELTDYHFHHPTDTISIFTDGSCTATSAAGSIYAGKGSKYNKSFSLPIQPVSTLAELYAIEAALIYAPKGHNIMIVTDSKAAIGIIKNYHSWGP
jgi:hypothetical protein